MDTQNASVKDSNTQLSWWHRSAKRIGPVLVRIGSGLLDHLYPPTCVHCNAANSPGKGGADLLCAKCWVRLRPITQPLCPRLGLPFEFDMGTDGLSAQAIADPPPFDRARSAMVHNGVARTIVSRLKFGDRPDMAVFCARMMALAGLELFDEQNEARRPVLVPVPLHRARQWQRRYNQSTQLARALGHQTGLEVDPFLIRRIKSTRPQIGLTAKQRVQNVAGAFRVQPDLLQRLNERRVVIVDDVITTGSTVKAMSKVLKKAGVEYIDVISFSRVVIGIDDSL